MTRSDPDPERACLQLPEWPLIDRNAWQRALEGGRGPFREDGGGRRPSSATVRKYQGGYGRWLGFLQRSGDLDLAGAPGERPTLERLDKYFEHLQRCGNADFTIVGRFAELRGALQLMVPGVKFPSITCPHGHSLKDMLPMRQRDLMVPSSDVLLEWAEKMFQDALLLHGPRRRCVQVRDAVMLAILAERGPRLRTVFELRIGQNLQRQDDGWALVMPGNIKKTKGSLTYPLSERVTPMLDRYSAVERRELLGDCSHDALWVNWSGKKLGKRGVEKRVRWRSEKEFGKPFGPHRCRTSLGTTTAQYGFEAPMDGSVILDHKDPQTTINHYNRSTGFAAGQRQVDRLQRLRRETAALAKRAFANKLSDPDPNADRHPR
jgi:hypothetical protein